MVQPTFDAVVIQRPLHPYEARVVLAQPNLKLKDSMTSSPIFLSVSTLSTTQFNFERNPCFTKEDFIQGFTDILTEHNLLRVTGLSH